MAEFGKSSAEKLSGCHWDIQKLMERVVLVRDISVVCGVRDRADQNKAFRDGKSKLEWPDSRHNIKDPKELSDAVDIVPWPEQYTDPMTMIHVAGIIMGIASEMYETGEIGSEIRWGGDWNRNADLNDQEFKDLWHFERVI